MRSPEHQMALITSGCARSQDLIITQMFFDIEVYTQFVADCKAYVRDSRPRPKANGGLSCSKPV